MKMLELENTSFEFLFQSTPVDNQTYKAQVGLYVIARKIGSSKAANESFLDNIMTGIKNEMISYKYTVCLIP